MFKQFKKHFRENFSFLENKKLFLAVSGGLDSMVLLHLFEQMDNYFAVVHCNFNLRAKESDGDEQFVYDYCTKREIYCVIGNFQTDFFAKQAKLSTQVAARTLRYDWFEEQLMEKKFDYVLTAHHLDDSLETFIINLSRGTGLDGLTGIPAINNKIIRPLLPFTRQEIEQYATENNILWKEDSSNETDKYLRNKIRHHVVPQLKDLNENFMVNFYNTQTYLQQSQNLVIDAVDLGASLVIEKKDDGVYFSIEKLMQLTDYKSFLFNCLKDFNFKSWNDIYDLIYAENGKKVLGADVQIQKYREFLILSEIEEEQIIEKYLIPDGKTFVKIPIKLTIKKVLNVTKESEERIFVDYDKVVFPIEIRRSLPEDIIYPLGMKGSKKVSKFLKDEHLSFTARARKWLLVDANNTIIWVVGLRADQRFSVTEDTKNILKIIYANR